MENTLCYIKKKINYNAYNAKMKAIGKDTDIRKLINKNIHICNSTLQSIVSFDREEHREEANVVLRQVCKLLQDTFHGSLAFLGNLVLLYTIADS